MALDDKDIFTAVFDRFKDQPIEYIMAQYGLARKLNMEIEKQAGVPVASEVTQPVEEAPKEEEAPAPAPAQPQHKRFTKRDLKMNPQEAITDDVIFCCLCGQAKQNLTAKHLEAHGISVEDYKKLCGYPEDQKLMSRRRLAKSREIIGMAQEARIRKNAIKNSY